MFELITIPEYRELAHIEATNKALQLAHSYVTHYISQQLNLTNIFDDPVKRKRSYIIQCQSLVTLYLFQSPIAPIFFDRKEFYKAFNNWNANSYVLIFCNELKRLME